MEKNLIAKFEVNVPKTAKALAKFVSNDDLRPMMKYVCINPSCGTMAATDTKALQVLKIEAAGEYADNLEVLAGPKHIAKVAGKHVTISVFEEVREVEETRTVYGWAFCGSRTETAKVNRTFQIVEIECGGETYTTETSSGTFPNVMRVIPRREGRKAIRLTAESVEALKTICKLHKYSNYIAMDIAEGSDSVTIYDEVKDYSDNRAAYTLKLAGPAGLTTTIGCGPRLLATCLNGSNGVISFHEDTPQGRPMMFDGEAETTILMPCNLGDDTFNHIADNRANIATAQSIFAEDAAAVVAELQHHAAELWQSIVSNYTKDGKCGLTPGNYSAKDLADRGTAKCGVYYFPDDDYENPLTIKHGNICLTVSYDELFSVLAAWENAVKCKKSVFAVGNVDEVATATDKQKTDEDGSIRAKVLQYKSDGNTLTEKTETLKKYADGVYYTEETESYSNIPTYRIIFEDNGVFWDSLRTLTGSLFNNPKERERIGNLRNDFRAGIQEMAQNNGFIRMLEIEVMRRLGYDTAPLFASREACLKRREGEERQRAEDAARREQQRQEAEQRRKAELLADGKEKLMAHEAVTVEQIELLAEAVNYKIHIRTLGFMREKVSEAILREDETVTVWGRELTARNINGTADVVREIAARIKAQAEAEAQQPATATETPQISTETAETVKCTTEGETAQKTATFAYSDVLSVAQGMAEEAKALGLCEVLKYKLQHPELKKWAVKYGLLDLVRKMTNAPEIWLGGLRIDANFRQSLNDNDKAIISAARVLLAKAALSAPQSTQTPQTANHATPAPKRRQRPRKQPIQTY